MALAPGTRIGVYDITALIGEGGMGQVYRATDATLGRQVAIKILPKAFAADLQRLARFEREAKTLASLNHPHIAAIYGFEKSSAMHALVMELVEGEDLSQRLARGAIPLEEALPIARQIAEGLEAAHQQGIVHRDLKPANIKLRSDGQVKVLDFGLAKIADPAGGSSPDGMNSPTLSVHATKQGVILGTAAYMSPEQARGLPVDRRTDIWAFGCVFYEMLTGTPAFGRDSVSDIVAAVLQSEPDWRALPPHTPGRLRLLLKRCLQKDSRQRLHDVADARIEIEDFDTDAIAAAATPVPNGAHRLAWAAVGALAGVAVAGVLWWAGARTGLAPAPIHLSLTLADKASSYGHMNASRELAISPDGQKIVYVAIHDGRRQLFLRSLGEIEGKPVDGTDGALTAFFSADSQWLAFGKGLELQKAAVGGGAPITICTLAGTGFFGGDWGPDNTIVFVADYNGGLLKVSANGGTPHPLLAASVDTDHVAYSDPQILPGGKGVLFTLASGRAVTADDQDVAVLAAGEKTLRILIRGASHPRYLPTGQIVYVHQGALQAVPFDISTLAVTGTPTTVIEGLGRTWSGDADYSVSDNGTVVYEADSGAATGGMFTLVDRKGAARPVSAKRGNYSEFSISPNGRSIASRVFAINDDIWTYDIATGAPLRFTFEPLDEVFPRWTADGSRIAYGSRTGTIFWKSSDGSGPREELTHGEFPRYPASFSADGRLMAFIEIHPTRRRDIWLMPLQGVRKPEPLVATDADERDARFSPDGQWLAYVSDETGRDEVFMRPVGARGGRRQLSSDGGTGPTWAPNGRELFFAAGDHLSVVSLDEHRNPIGRDRVLFAIPKLDDLQPTADAPLYDVMPDGEHFVFLLDQSSARPQFNIILNWFEELKPSRPSK